MPTRTPPTAAIVPALSGSSFRYATSGTIAAEEPISWNTLKRTSARNVRSHGPRYRTRVSSPSDGDGRPTLVFVAGVVVWSLELEPAAEDENDDDDDDAAEEGEDPAVGVHRGAADAAANPRDAVEDGAAIDRTPASVAIVVVRSVAAAAEPGAHRGGRARERGGRATRRERRGGGDAAGDDARPRRHRRRASAARAELDATTGLSISPSLANHQSRERERR